MRWHEKQVGTMAEHLDRESTVRPEPWERKAAHLPERDRLATLS